VTGKPPRQFPALLAHVYSSGDSYLTSRPARALSGFQPHPDVGQLTVEVGRAPRWLFRARGRFFAINPLSGGNFAGWLEGTAHDPKFRLRRGELSRPWYTTLVLEVAPVGLRVRQWETVRHWETVLREAAVLLASEFSASVIERLELRGLFLQGATGEWVKVPEFHVPSPSVYVGRQERELQEDLQRSQHALQVLQVGTSASPPWMEWVHRALLTEEPWSQFVWLMFSLEQASIACYGWMTPEQRQAFRTAAEGHVRGAVQGASLVWKRPSITMRFATVAAFLSATTAASDTAAFYRLRGIRDNLLHGTRADAPGGEDVRAARRLALTYVRLVSLAPIRP